MPAGTDPVAARTWCSTPAWAPPDRPGHPRDLSPLVITDDQIDEAQAALRAALS